MNARADMILISVIETLWDMLLLAVASSHRRWPLPPEVAKAYTRRRLQRYRSYHRELDAMQLAYSLVALTLRTALLLLPVCIWIEALSLGPYATALVSCLVYLRVKCPGHLTH